MKRLSGGVRQRPKFTASIEYSRIVKDGISAEDRQKLRTNPYERGKLSEANLKIIMEARNKMNMEKLNNMTIEEIEEAGLILDINDGKIVKGTKEAV